MQANQLRIKRVFDAYDADAFGTILDLEQGKARKPKDAKHMRGLYSARVYNSKRKTIRTHRNGKRR